MFCWFSSFTPYPFYGFCFSLPVMSPVYVFVSQQRFAFCFCYWNCFKGHDTARRSFFPSMAFMVSVFQKAFQHPCHQRGHLNRVQLGGTNAIEWDRVGQTRFSIWLGASCSFWQFLGGFSFRQVQTLLSSMFDGRHIYIFSCRNRHRTLSLAKNTEDFICSVILWSTWNLYFSFATSTPSLRYPC